MPVNPFKPPDADVKDRPRPGSPLRAVLTGLVIDIGGSAVIGILLSMVYAATLSAAGRSPDEVAEAMKHIPPDSGVAILGTLLGAGCSVLGGYACARVVQRDEYRVGGVMAVLSATIGLLLGSGDDTPADLDVLLTLSTFACVLLGAKYGCARNRRDDGPSKGAPRP